MTISNTADTALSLKAKEQLLIDTLGQAGSIIIAYSGGVDSSLLAYYARRTLGRNAKIVIAVSPSLAEEELSAARAQAEQFEWELIEITTNEVDKAEYQRNDLMRCYFCKSTLFEELDKMSEKLAIARIAYGANVDDLSDFRPGHKAAREHHVLSPLQSAQLTKVDIRELAKQAALPSWDRPQAACLSSRFPTFVQVTAPALSRVDKAESFIHSLGFRQIRVRNHVMPGDPATGEKQSLLARIEVEKSELERFSSNVDLMNKVDEELKKLGYDFVSLDLAGYRQGSGNAMSRKLGEEDGSL
ncbi:MAG TPA: ATP-dependent sacrificial sulfur transferase LarE [Planktothrix sp.]